jgi:hypothetical protein
MDVMEYVVRRVLEDVRHAALDVRNLQRAGLLSDDEIAEGANSLKKLGANGAPEYQEPIEFLQWLADAGDIGWYAASAAFHFIEDLDDVDAEHDEDEE